MHPHGGPPPPPLPPGPHGGVYAQPPPPKPSGIPYIGSRISLISKTDIRYEGFLFNIDTQQSMVALQHVRSFGTEGRRSEHIPPSDHVLPYATFKASEIKDLHVCEAAPPVYGSYAPPPPPMPQPPYAPQAPYGAPPPPPPPPAVPAPPPPPASPPKANVPSPVKAKPTAPTLLTPGSVSSAQVPKPPSPKKVEESVTSEEPHTSHSRHHRESGGPRTIPGMGGHLLKRKERRVPGGDGEGSTVTTGNDFNFETGLTTFHKEEEFEKLSINDTKPKAAYQKSSFFDTISCDALDRLEGKTNRFTAGQERTLNTETFGAVGLNNNNRRGYRGNRSGGGRGGNRRNNSGGQRNGGGRGGGGNRNGNPSQA